VSLPVPFPLAPMEARSADALPEGERWAYEPKWDGFRCLVFRDGADVRLQSKSKKPLGRYFPDVVDAVRALRPRAFVLDGELVVPDGDRTDFDALLQRIHPAQSRVAKLAASHPARLVVFDLLASGPRTSLLERAWQARRPALERWGERYLEGTPCALSPATRDRDAALGWLEALRGIDGVVAKDRRSPYLAGSRDGVIKVKRIRTADCVVGGYREASRGGGVGSLLLGLYDADGLLHHVGYTSGLRDRDRASLLERLAPLVPPQAGESPSTGAASAGDPAPAGFSGNAPGAPNRWSGGQEKPWTPLRPELVVEVAYDQVTHRRFRHGTRIVRWRPDKAPGACTLAQIERRGAGALRLLADASGEG
jgi:ATP-dependent DNA ligase